MKTIKLLALLFISTLIFTSCGPDEIDPEPEPEPTVEEDYENGFFVINEGNWGAGNASLTFVSDDYETIESNVYSTVNAVALGDVAQSIFTYGNKAYIVVNGSNKIEIVNRYTMENLGTITGAEVNNPRYMVAVGSTGYLSNWGDSVDATDDFIAIIDLDTDTVTGAVGVGEGPEKMLATADKVYVNLQGGWGQNNKVVVIDTTTNTISSNIEVHDVPNSIIGDGSGNVWVLCGGKPSYTGDETAAAIIKIEGESVTLTHELAATQHPQHMTYDGDTLYYHLDGQVYTRATTVSSFLETVPGLEGSYYGMYAKDGKLYTLDAGDSSSEGTLRVFNITTAALENTVTTGIIPNGVAFN